VNYYLVTFTLPCVLCPMDRRHSKTVYSLLMRCVAETLKTFGLNKKGLHAQLGLCAVLHTHNRRLGYHPHVHIVVPGGGINRSRRQWRKLKLKGRYLFSGRALGAMFRGSFLNALEKAGLTPDITPKRWIVHCKGVGRGEQVTGLFNNGICRGSAARHILICYVFIYISTFWICN
jgi:hypothetical protein